MNRPLLSPATVWVIGRATVTQLIRMKAFYFIVGFLLLIVCSRAILPPSSPAADLMNLRKAVFGGIDVFAWLFTIIATALLIPKDIEDRTLYTILAKPVRRGEYLLGKLFGVLSFIAMSLVIMFFVASAVIALLEGQYVAEETALMQERGISAEEISSQLEFLKSQGFRWTLALAAFVSFLKASVVAAVTMFLSTFATSSLFSIIVSVVLFLIGHAHSLVSSYYAYQTEDSPFVASISGIMKILIPDYRIFSSSEGIVAGETVTGALMLQTGALAGGYVFVFYLLSLFVFVDKEC